MRELGKEGKEALWRKGVVEQNEMGNEKMGWGNEIRVGKEGERRGRS